MYYSLITVNLILMYQMTIFSDIIYIAMLIDLFMCCSLIEHKLLESTKLIDIPNMTNKGYRIIQFYFEMNRKMPKMSFFAKTVKLRK